MMDRLKRIFWLGGSKGKRFLWVVLLIIAFTSAVRVAGSAHATSRDATAADDKRQEEFARLAAQIELKRQQGEEEEEKLQEKALGLLDETVLEELNSGQSPNVTALNEQLSRFVSGNSPAGEDYHITPLGGITPIYALTANLGVGGPSAVRLYAKSGGTTKYQRAARLDRYTQKEFFDEYLVLIPVSAPDVFVTVSGRTDELQTGSFNAWQFTGQGERGIRLLWASDLLPFSSYENRPDGFRITYCGEPNEEKPRECRGMFQDRYAWDGSAWKLAEHRTVPPGHH